MTDLDREKALAAAFLRPKSLLVRPFSTAVITLARALDIALVLPRTAPAELRNPPPETARLQDLALCWLLDRRHSLNEVKAAAALPWPDFVARFLSDDLGDDSYPWTLSPVIFAAAQAEIAQEIALLALSDFTVAAKPAGKSSSDSPPGK